MKRHINISILAALMIAVSLSFVGCTGVQKQEDSTVSGETGTKEGEGHGEEKEVSLTEEQMESVEIKIGTIEQKQLASIIKVNGFLRVPNNKKANATSLFGGVIQTLQIEIGQNVKKGEVIATISNPQFIQLQEEYLTINSRIEYAVQELERQQDLNESNAGAKKNLQSANAEVSTLRSRKASLQQQILMMGIDPNSLSASTLKSSLIVKSPIKGTISSVFAKIGSYVDVSSPIAEIVENNALHADLKVYEKDVSGIAIGQQVDFVVTNSPDKQYSAKVYNINSSFDEGSKTITAHCEITGDKVGLIDGMNISALVNLGGQMSQAVPNEAIVNSDGKYYIFIVRDRSEQEETNLVEDEGQHRHGKQTRFERIEIVKGASELGYTAISPVGEISDGAKIVVKNAFFVNAKLNDSGEDDHSH